MLRRGGGERLNILLSSKLLFIIIIFFFLGGGGGDLSRAYFQGILSLEILRQQLKTKNPNISELESKPLYMYFLSKGVSLKVFLKYECLMFRNNVKD